MKRLNTYFDSHPVRAMIAGWVVLFAVVLTSAAIEADFHPQHTHRSAT
ncbi:hypothetical protein M3I54_22720 [Paraburkholderia sp. CNPSo 3274]|nr:hypothetical protein [Paraburkholderia sp. CNPSo 3274]MCP3709761.1 hypothetical protein [Paraburkholderia sp. CNPSo 3274]